MLATFLYMLAMLLPLSGAQRLHLALVMSATAAYVQGIVTWALPRYRGHAFALLVLTVGNVMIATLAIVVLRHLGLHESHTFYFLIVALTAGLGGLRLALVAAVLASTILFLLGWLEGSLGEMLGWLDLAFPTGILVSLAIMVSAVVDSLKEQWKRAARRNADLLRLEQRRATQMATLQSLSTRLSAGLDLEGVCQTLFEVLGQLMPTDAFSICLYEEAEGIRHHVFNVEGGNRVSEMRQPMDNGVTSYVIRTRQPVLVPDAAEETRFEILRWGTEGPPTVSLLSAPMLTKDKVAGVVSTQSYVAGGFDENDLQVLTQFAAQAAIAIDNVRLLQSERRRADTLNALRATTMDLSAELELPALLTAIMERAMALLDTSGGEVALLSPGKEYLDVVVSKNLGKDQGGMRIQLGEGVIGRVAETGQPLVIDDYQHWPGRMTEYDGQSFHAVMGAPLIVRGQMLGVIAQATAVPGRHFTTADLALLNLFSGHAAAAVENARQYHNERRRAEQQEALLEVARIVGSTLEIDEALERIGEQIQRVVPGDTFFVSLVEGDSQTIEYLVDEGQRFSPTTVPLKNSLSRWVTTHKQPLRLGDVSRESPALGVEMLTLGKDRASQSWLGVPMLAGGACLGLVSAASYRPNAYGESDEEVLSQIGAHAALAIANARIHAEVQRQARNDSLTGVSNHGHFLVELDQAIAAAEEVNGRVSVIMLDIDYFKHYNDTYGHMAGDEVLRLTVQAIKRHIKRTDIAGRWGGEEFGIGLLDANGAQAMEVARRIQSTLAQMTLTIRGQSIPVPTISQGVASYPDNASDSATLVDVADHALYHAKNHGRNQIYCAHPH